MARGMMRISVQPMIYIKYCRSPEHVRRSNVVYTYVRSWTYIPMSVKERICRAEPARMGLLNRAVILNFLFPEESPLSDSKSDPNARAHP